MPVKTAMEVATDLLHLLATRPELKTRPVHMLDMAGETGDGLVTWIEIDKFTSTVGLVISLLANFPGV